jgi:hypothetical protein
MHYRISRSTDNSLHSERERNGHTPAGTNCPAIVMPPSVTSLCKFAGTGGRSRRAKIKQIQKGKHFRE